MVCDDPNDLWTCYCPAQTPDGQKNPLNEEQCRSLGPDVPEMSDSDLASLQGGGGGNKGERGKTARPDGTQNPFKKLRPDPKDPTKVIYKDPHTGHEVRKPKPPGFDEYWNSIK